MNFEHYFDAIWKLVFNYLGIQLLGFKKDRNEILCFRPFGPPDKTLGSFRFHPGKQLFFDSTRYLGISAITPSRFIAACAGITLEEAKLILGKLMRQWGLVTNLSNQSVPDTLQIRPIARMPAPPETENYERRQRLLTIYDKSNRLNKASPGWGTKKFLDRRGFSLEEIQAIPNTLFLASNFRDDFAVRLGLQNSTVADLTATGFFKENCFGDAVPFWGHWYRLVFPFLWPSEAGLPVVTGFRSRLTELPFSSVHPKETSVKAVHGYPATQGFWGAMFCTESGDYSFASDPTVYVITEGILDALSGHVMLARSLQLPVSMPIPGIRFVSAGTISGASNLHFWRTLPSVRKIMIAFDNDYSKAINTGEVAAMRLLGLLRPEFPVEVLPKEILEGCKDLNELLIASAQRKTDFGKQLHSYLENKK